MGMKRFVPKKRSKRKSESQAPPEEEQLKELQDMFEIPEPREAQEEEEPLPVGGISSELGPAPDLLDDDLRQGVFGASAGTASSEAPLDLSPSGPLAEEMSPPEVTVRPINAMGDPVSQPVMPDVQPIDLGPEALIAEEAVEELPLPEAAPTGLGLDALPEKQPLGDLPLPEAAPIDLGLDALPVEQPLGDLPLPEAAPIDLGLDALPVEQPLGDLPLPEASPIDLGLDALPMEQPLGDLPLPEAQPIGLAPESVSLVDLGAGTEAPPPIEGRPMTLTPEAPAVPEAPTSAPGQKPGEVLDSGGVNLKDIFRKKVVANPQVKNLLNRHGRVDVHELVDELQELARSVGAIEEEE